MDSPYTTSSGREMSISERFQVLAAQKMQKASEMTAEDDAKRVDALRNNRIIQLYAYLSGETIDGDPLEDELALLEYPEEELTVDESGHLCLIKDLKKKKEEEQAANSKKVPVKTPENTDTTADSETDDVLAAAAEQRRLALRNANRTPHGVDGDEDDDLPVFGTADSRAGAVQNESLPDSQDSGNAGNTENTEDTEDNSIPVNEDAAVLRLEDINFTEARVYISVAENKNINEQAFGVFIEQGYGASRHVFTYGERMRGSNLESMAYRAASVALDMYQRAGQPIHDVTIFIERDLGWALSQNSWSLTNNIYGPNLDAELYSNIFRACAANNVRIRIAPAKAAGYGQNMADTIAQTLVQAPI